MGERHRGIGVTVATTDKIKGQMKGGREMCTAGITVREGDKRTQRSKTALWERLLNSRRYNRMKT